LGRSKGNPSHKKDRGPNTPRKKTVKRPGGRVLTKRKTTQLQKWKAMLRADAIRGRIRLDFEEEGDGEKVWTHEKK